jgi:hypothetical protein
LAIQLTFKPKRDIYGALLDAVVPVQQANPISAELWKDLRRLDWVCTHWRSVDNGIWEVRGPQRHFVYSKLMCWVAVDRALRLAFQRSFPADRRRWLQCRDEIYQDILDQGWNPERRSFVQSYGSTALDAACLVMPLVFFMSPSDPMMLDPISAVTRPLNQGGVMSGDGIYRYSPEHTDDGLPGDEGMFNMCTFWLVEALTRASRADPSRLREARLLFEKMLGLSNHLGLYSEESGLSGEALGNFPQAFTHLGLISAAFNLDRALGTPAVNSTQTTAGRLKWCKSYMSTGGELCALRLISVPGISASAGFPIDYRGCSDLECWHDSCSECLTGHFQRARAGSSKIRQLRHQRGVEALHERRGELGVVIRSATPRLDANANRRDGGCDSYR